MLSTRKLKSFNWNTNWNQFQIGGAWHTEHILCNVMEHKICSQHLFLSSHSLTDVYLTVKSV